MVKENERKESKKTNYTIKDNYYIFDVGTWQLESSADAFWAENSAVWTQLCTPGSQP